MSSVSDADLSWAGIHIAEQGFIDNLRSEGIMTIEPDDVVKSARAVSDAGDFVEKAARATKPDRSTLGRLAEAVSIIRLGSRLLPAGVRLFKRYPVTSTVGVVGLILAVYLIRPSRMSTRL